MNLGGSVGAWEELRGRSCDFRNVSTVFVNETLQKCKKKNQNFRSNLEKPVQSRNSNAMFLLENSNIPMVLPSKLRSKISKFFWLTSIYC